MHVVASCFSPLIGSVTMPSTPTKPPDPPPECIFGVPMEDPQILLSSTSDDPLPSQQRKRTAGDVSGVAPKKSSPPSDSNQTVYTHPNYDSSRKYTDKDAGPFIVHAFREESHPKAGTTLNPIQFGQMLMRANVQGISRHGVKSVGRNRVSVDFKSASDANRFIREPALRTYKFAAIIPSYNVTRMGIVRNIPTEWSMLDLISEVELPEGCGDILKARRLNRKVVRENDVVWVPTRTVVLTFEGQVLPPKIYCCHTIIEVSTYELPTIQCNSCCRFGHTQDKCRSSPKCFRCGQAHLGNTCSVLENDALCIHCTGNHFATNKRCREHTRQKDIKFTMAQENISYIEAAKRFPVVLQPTYADVSRTLFSPSPRSQPLSQSRAPQKPAAPASPRTPTSSRRTIYSPISPRVSHSPGYDRIAHQALISQRDPPSPQNGAALKAPSVSQNDNLIDIALSLLINLFGKFNDSPPPSNVAQKLDLLFKLVKIPDNSVELSEYYSQEA